MPLPKFQNSSKFFLDKTEEIASGQTVLRDVFQPLAMGRLIFHCSNVFVSSFSHPLFVRIIGAAPYLGIRACACPVACRSSFTPEPRHPSINQTDGYVFFSFPSPRTGHVCLILAVSPDRTISAPLPKGVGKTIARPLPIMLAVQRFFV